MYKKPTIVVNEELAEGIYAASGDCYSVTTNIHQKPETGRGDYRIQVNGMHAAADAHHSGEQVLTLTFNQSVEYVGSNGNGSGMGNVVTITYNYHNNGNDNIGLGDVIVKSDVGLAIVSAVLSCNHDCGQH